MKYPQPHNLNSLTMQKDFCIVNDGDGRYTIELAVAGYTKDDIEVYAEDNSVVVEGKKLNDPKRDYIHKGMSYKAFKRVFPLSKNMTIEDATFENGVLSIHLTKSEELKKLIEIN